MIIESISNTMGTAVKVFFLVGSWLMYQLSAIENVSPESFLNRAFDQLFSLGLLVIFVGYLIYENKRKDKKAELASDKSVELLESSIDAMNKFSISQRDIAKSIERSAETQAKSMEKMATIFDRIIDRLDRE